MKMNDDITKSSIALLLVMAIIISVLSTMSVINAFEKTQMSTKIIDVPDSQEGPRQGSVSLSIIGPEEKQTETGTISFTIIER